VIGHPAPPLGVAVIRNDAISVQSVVTAHGALSTRPETATDEAFLFSLFESVKGPMFARMSVDDEMKARLLHMQFRAMTQSYRASCPTGAFQIVTLDGAPIGQLITDIAADRIYVVYIALLPSWRDRGIGSALMRALLTRAQALDLGCEATVALGNIPSLRLWAAFGFVERTRDAANVILEWRPSAPKDT
jgi:ribosomal protein S18 acetylase RimI-like enzyme